jgi:hypothetical protein
MNTVGIATEDFLKATIAKHEERINDLTLHSQKLAQRDYETAGTLQQIRDDMFTWTMNALEEREISETNAEAIAEICGFELKKEFELEVTVQYSITVNAKNEIEALDEVNDIDFDNASYGENVTYLSSSVDRTEII